MGQQARKANQRPEQLLLADAVLELEAGSCTPVVEPSKIRPAEDAAIPLSDVPVTSVSPLCQALGGCARSKGTSSTVFRNCFPSRGSGLQLWNSLPSRHGEFRHLDSVPHRRKKSSHAEGTGP